MSALFYNIRFTLSRWSALRADRIETRRQAGVIDAFDYQQGER